MFLEKAKALVPGVKLRYAERLRDMEEPALRIGLELPEGISLLGDEAFMIDDMAVKLSEAQKYRVSANMTPVAGDGDLRRHNRHDAVHEAMSACRPAVDSQSSDAVSTAPHSATLSRPLMSMPRCSGDMSVKCRSTKGRTRSR